MCRRWVDEAQAVLLAHARVRGVVRAAVAQCQFRRRCGRRIQPLLQVRPRPHTWNGNGGVSYKRGGHIAVGSVLCAIHTNQWATMGLQHIRMCVRLGRQEFVADSVILFHCVETQ